MNTNTVKMIYLSFSKDGLLWALGEKIFAYEDFGGQNDNSLYEISEGKLRKNFGIKPTMFEIGDTLDSQ